MIWRFSLLLLFALPPLAIALNPHPIASVMIIAWTMLIIPLCFMHLMDYLRNSHRKKNRALELLLRAPLLLLGALSSLFGLSIVAWCLYNVFVQLLPEYSGPKSVLELLLEGFGIGPLLLLFGFYLISSACHKNLESADLPRLE